MTDANWDRQPFLPVGQLTAHTRMPTVALTAGARTLDLPAGPALDVDSLSAVDPLTGRHVGLDVLMDRRLRTDALLVLHRGEVRYETYRGGFRADDRHLVHSMSKTLVATAVAVAIDEGALATEDPISRYVPMLTSLQACDGVTLQHVLDMTVGVASEEHYEDPDSMYWTYADAVGYYGTAARCPVGGLVFLAEHLVERAHPPGHRFEYASYITNLLPVALAAGYDRPAAEVIEEKVYGRLGAEHDAWFNLDPVGDLVAEGHLNLTLRDTARWASLLLDGGRNLAGEQVLPGSWTDDTIRERTGLLGAFQRGDYAGVFPGAQYRNNAWVLEPGRVLALLGIHGQFCLLDLEDRLMVVGFGSYPTQVDAPMVASMLGLWEAIRAATGGRSTG